MRRGASISVTAVVFKGLQPCRPSQGSAGECSHTKRGRETESERKRETKTERRKEAERDRHKGRQRQKGKMLRLCVRSFLLLSRSVCLRSGVFVDAVGV